MELGIRNFTEAGNNLMWRSGWRSYQKEKCLSKGYARMENKAHYDRILNSLTDNRSIDVLDEPSMENVKKMPEKEFIIKYIEEVRGKMTPQEIAVAIAVALDVPVEDTVRIRSIFAMVMEQLKNSPPELAQVSIAIDGRTVEINADAFGVTASENPISFQFPTNVRTDEETGERAVEVWGGDNQAIVRGSNFTSSGQRITEVPAQFSVPTSIPPELRGIRYSRLGLPDTNPISVVTSIKEISSSRSSQTEGDYPAPPYPLEYSPTATDIYNVAIIRKEGEKSREMTTQTAQRGKEGKFDESLREQRMREEFMNPTFNSPLVESRTPTGGLKYTNTQPVYAPKTPIYPIRRTASGVKVFSPIIGQTNPASFSQYMKTQLGNYAESSGIDPMMSAYRGLGDVLGQMEAEQGGY